MAIVSDILQATPAPADGSPTPARTWQWLRDGATITSATSSAYTTVDADANKSITVRQIETNFMGAASATSIAFATVDPFQVVAALFSVSEPGVWLDPSDTSTLFQDVAGTIPVTATGQTVALALDKSKGLALGPELVTNGDFSSAAGWTLGAGVTISGGVLSRTGADGTVAGASRSFAITPGRTYLAEMEVIANDATTQLFIDNGSDDVNASLTLGSVGVIRRLFIAQGSSVTISANFRQNTNGTIDNISVKELAGNHLTQATAASRPIYGIEPFGGRRNLLRFTEQFDDGSWAKIGTGGTTIAPNVVVSPDGTIDADKLIANPVAGTHFMRQAVTISPSTAYTFSIYVKAGEVSSIRLFLFSTAYGTTFNASTGAFTGTTAGATTSAQSVGNGWYRATISATSSASPTSLLEIYTADNNAGNGTDGILIWGAQLETGSLATPYQRVTDQWNVTEAGKASVSYLAFDGTDDFLVSPTITPGIDKAQVFAGVRKLDTSSAYQCIVETSTDSRVNNGSLSVFKSGSSSQYYYITRGSLYLDATSTTSFSSPITNVLQVSNDIAQSTASAELMSRVDGVSNSLTYTNGPTAGTGNFLAYPLYVGRRGGTSLPFNGRMYQMIVRFGANLSAERIARTEQLINEKTGAIVPPVSTLSLDFIAQEYDYGL